VSAATVCKTQPQHPDNLLSAVQYQPRVPDGGYLALCTHVHHDRHSRNYGERVYLYFQLCDCAHEGKTIRGYLKPSRWPTSNFYRSWAIARGGPPKSRNTKMSARVFYGKLFRVLTVTVKPKHRIAGADGKMRPGPSLPESFWYSKVACILELIATNEKIATVTTLNPTLEGGAAPLHPPIILTNFSFNPFSGSALSEGEVGRRELGDGNKRESDLAVRDGTTIATLHNQPVEGEISLPAPSPQAKLERDKETLRARGHLP
jgi:hypothetical protein